jgi:hypothetical protein
MSNRINNPNVLGALKKARLKRKENALKNENTIKAIKFYLENCPIGYSELAGMLNAERIKSPRGKYWSPTTARQLVLNFEAKNKYL